MRVQLVLLGLIVSMGVSAQTLYFSEDFEAELSTAPQPVWSWPSAWSPGNPYGMFYGENDFYNRSAAVKHNGGYSLKFDYEGRGGWGNRCITAGAVTKTHAGATGAVFVASDGSNLATVIGESGAEPGSYVWNLSANMERWTVATVENQSATNDKLTFTGGAFSYPGVQNLGTGVFTDGDKVLIGRICPLGERRLDMDLLENNLAGFSPGEFPSSGSIYTRIYIYLPTATTMANWTQKLFRFTPAEGYGATCSIHGDDADPARVLALECGGAVWVTTNFKVPRDTWVYLEIEAKSASSSGAGDAALRVWVEVDGVSPAAPKIELTNLNYFGVDIYNKLITIIGNNQNDIDAIGAMYFDDIAISSQRLGPIPLQAAPKPPSILQVK